MWFIYNLAVSLAVIVLLQGVIIVTLLRQSTTTKSEFNLEILEGLWWNPWWLFLICWLGSGLVARVLYSWAVSWLLGIWHICPHNSSWRWIFLATKILLIQVHRSFTALGGLWWCDHDNAWLSHVVKCHFLGHRLGHGTRWFRLLGSILLILL